MTSPPLATTGSDPRGNVADLLARAAAAHPRRPAVISNNGARSWAELDAAVDRGVHTLRSRGLQIGDRVVVSLPTGANIIAALFAVARAGLVAVPVGPTRTEIDQIAATTSAAAVIGDQQDVGDAIQLRDAQVERWWSAHPIEPAAGDNRKTAGGEDLAVLAGAGSGPHPVMISHRAVLAAVRSIGGAPSLAMRSDDRALLVLPLYHLAGWVTAFLPLTAVGGAAVVPELPEQSGQWMDAVLEAVRAHHVSIIPAAPSLYRRLRTGRNVERALASVRLMTSGASPLHPEDFAAIRTGTGHSVWEGYGISEASSAVATSLMTRAPRPGSVGLPLPGMELRIIGDDDDADVSEPGDAEVPAPVTPGEPATGAAEHDITDGADADDSGAAGAAPDDSAATSAIGASGKPASPTPPVGVDDDEIVAEVPGDGGVGRIAIRGPNLFSGYWPDGSAAPDGNGWFITGDVGYLDDSGELHLVDRVAESLVVAGFTVYPREVEDVLNAHPYVRDAAVIGVPGRAGLAVLAVLVAQRGTRPTPEDLDDFIASRLPVFKRPSRYRVVDRLPRTEVGRIDRDEVRRNYLADPDPELGLPVRLAAGESGKAADDAAKSVRVPKAPGRARVGPDNEEDLF